MWSTIVELEYFIASTAWPTDLPAVIAEAKNGFLLMMKDERPKLALWVAATGNFVDALGAEIPRASVHAWASLTYPLDKQVYPADHRAHLLTPDGPYRDWAG